MKKWLTIYTHNWWKVRCSLMCIEGICIVCEKWMFVITPQPYLDLCAVMHVANSDRCRQAHTCKSLFHKDKHNNSLPLPTQTHAQGARLQVHHTYRKCDTLFIIRSQHIYCRLVLILLKLFWWSNDNVLIPMCGGYCTIGIYSYNKSRSGEISFG